jgi:hypothetical protein
VSDRGSGHPLLDCITTFIRFYHYKYVVDAFQVMSISGFTPVACTWKAQRGNIVVPQGLAIAGPFAQDRIASGPGVGEPP